MVTKCPDPFGADGDEPGHLSSKSTSDWRRTQLSPLVRLLARSVALAWLTAQDQHIDLHSATQNAKVEE
jgi:hypothetical protein